uniref:Uncharacterized protein n=1 Tax=Anguilla anguilla TaxID=7936 RepID=A0A0E9V7C0_ANGAN
MGGFFSSPLDHGRVLILSYVLLAILVSLMCS